MAEWLRRGLQILARRFDSGSGLHVAKAKLALANAALAQLVEHIIRNDGVTCSSHVSGTTSFTSLFQYLTNSRASADYRDNSAACGARLLEPGAWKRL